MINPETLNCIRECHLKCFEYEVGLFLCLLTKPNEIADVLAAVATRDDYNKILEVSNNVNKQSILSILSYAGMELEDVSLESQNDAVGPADIVITARNRHGETKKIGISVKYNNEVICNYTGRDILTEEQIEDLNAMLPQFGERYIHEMTERFGTFEEWYRIRFNTKQKIQSAVTNEFIDLVRNSVVERWEVMSEEKKEQFLHKVYHTDSKIDYWIFSFQKNGKFVLSTNPPYLRRAEYSRVTIEKEASQYLVFKIDGKKIGKTQVKFNNGIFERYTSKSYNDAIENGDEERADQILRRYINRGKGTIVEGKPLKYGNPFTSWNFEISF